MENPDLTISITWIFLFQVREDGIVVYANEASFPLLAIWEINKGEKLPSNIMAFVRKTILKKGTQDVEIKEREYSLTFKSPGDGYIYIQVPLQKIWLFYKKSEKHHKWGI